MKKIALVLVPAALVLVGACSAAPLKLPVSADNQIELEQAALGPTKRDPNALITCTARASNTTSTMKFRGGKLVLYKWSGGYEKAFPVTEKGRYVIDQATFYDIELARDGRSFKGKWRSPYYSNDRLKFKCDDTITSLAVLQ